MSDVVTVVATSRMIQGRVESNWKNIKKLREVKFNLISHVFLV